MALRVLSFLEKIKVKDAVSLQTASTKDQAETISTGDITVTIPNPHTVKNNQATAANIFIKLAGETTFTDYYFLGGQSEVMAPIEIGGSTTGSDSGTKIVIKGLE